MSDEPVYLDPKYTVQQLAEWRRKKEGAADPPQSPLDRRLSLGLDLDKNGVAIPNLSNCAVILERDKGLQRIVWWCEFRQRIMTDERAPREWTDADDIETAIYIQTELGIPRMTKDTVANAVIAYARRNPRNCVRDWLDALSWDGITRLPHFFTDNFGVHDSEYSRAVGRNFFIGLIARIYKPGCQLKNMVILEGVQDASKSSALNLLVGDAWFAEQHESVGGKGFFEVIQGKWLIEIPEMDAFTRAESSRVKAVVSCRSDRFRASYGRHAQDHPRQCAFVGTTNKDDGGVFNDDTGAVRFWPLACRGAINMQAITRDRGQLFAEAVSLFKDGAPWWLVPRDQAEAEQRARYVLDIWHDDIALYIDAQISGEVTINQVLEHLGRKKQDQNRMDQLRVASSLKILGWTKRDARRGDRVVKVWMNKDKIASLNSEK